MYQHLPATLTMVFAGWVESPGGGFVAHGAAWIPGGSGGQGQEERKREREMEKKEYCRDNIMVIENKMETKK